MDIVRRAYLQTLKDIEPEAESASYFHERMAWLMVSWIVDRVYPRGDWPKELGEYPEALARQIKEELRLERKAR